MAQRDYILRIIERMGAALAEIRRPLTGGEDPASVRADLGRTASGAGFDLDTLRLFVSPTGEVEPARCWIMAEVLYLDGLGAERSGRDARDSLTKARALYELIRPAGGMLLGLPEATERIAEIDRLLDPDVDGASRDADHASVGCGPHPDRTGNRASSRGGAHMAPTSRSSPAGPYFLQRPTFASTASGRSSCSESTRW